MFLMYIYLSKTLSGNDGIRNHQLALISENILKNYWCSKTYIFYVYILKPNLMKNNGISLVDVSVLKDGLFFQTLTCNDNEFWKLQTVQLWKFICKTFIKLFPLPSAIRKP